MKKILGLTLIAILGGCTDKSTDDTDAASSSDSMSDTSATGTPPTTTQPTTANTTDLPGTTSGETTVAGSSSTDGSVTDAPTSTTSPGSETSTDDGGIMAGCAAVCDAAAACGLPTGGASCAMDCFDDLGGAMGQCELAIEPYLACLADMDCRQLIALFTDEDLGPCADAAALVEQSCDDLGDECVSGGGGNPQGTQCSHSIECQGEPLLEMQCNNNQCVCLVDDVEVATCPAEMVCKSLDQLLDKAADCCGF